MFGILKLLFWKRFCFLSVFSIQQELHFQKERCEISQGFKGVRNNYNEIETMLHLSYYISVWLFYIVTSAEDSLKYYVKF